MPTRKGDAEPMDLHGQAVADRELVLGTGIAMDKVTSATLDRCTLVLVNPAAVHFYQTRFRECVVRPKKKVQTVWSDCAWEGCTFHGRYVSTHFGSFSVNLGPSPWEGKVIRGCDFSRATMYHCIFVRTDVASVTFPGWPCFAVLRPWQNLAAWKAAPLPLPPYVSQSWFDGLAHADAMVTHWPSIAKDYKIDADPEEVRRVLQTLDFVRV